MKRIVFALSVLVLALCAGASRADEIRVYPSPDGKFRALVIPLHGSSESQVVLRAADGTLLCSQSYASDDGEHGFIVERVAWTPDSHFLVYSLSSSGGHQPWHSPTNFIATRDFRVRRLDDYIGAVMDPEFKLLSPDIIRVVCQRKEGDITQIEREVSLGELLNKEGKAKKPHR